MTESPIDTYINEVAKQLKLRGHNRRQALADLRELLTEAAAATSPAQAIVEAGQPHEYAANLDEQFANDSANKTILGIPNSFTRGIGARMAATFNPTDERVFIPRVFGAGWTLNMGALAVRLGLLNPDDIDDEVLDTANDYLPLTRLAASVPVMAGAAATALLWRRRQQAAAATGKSQTPSLVFGVAVPVIAAGLLVASADYQEPAQQRLTMPAIAASLGLLTAGTNTQSALRPNGRGFVLAAVAASIPASLLLSYLPVRAAVRKHLTES